MNKYLFLTLLITISCSTNLIKVNELNNVKHHDLKSTNASYLNEADSTKSETISPVDSIINNHKYSDIIKKYINKLPHKDIQIKKAIEYKIPIDLVIVWNFQESDFTNVTHNGKLNGNRPKDWGALQVNASGNNKIVKTYILNNEYEKYYDLAYRFMWNKYNKNKKKWFTNWNSRNPKQANKYYSDFLVRTNKNNRDLRKLL